MSGDRDDTMDSAVREYRVHRRLPCPGCAATSGVPILRDMPGFTIAGAAPDLAHGGPRRSEDDASHRCLACAHEWTPVDPWDRLVAWDELVTFADDPPDRPTARRVGRWPLTVDLDALLPDRRPAGDGRGGRLAGWLEAEHGDRWYLVEDRAADLEALGDALGSPEHWPFVPTLAVAEFDTAEQRHAYARSHRSDEGDDEAIGA